MDCIRRTCLHSSLALVNMQGFAMGLGWSCQVLELQMQKGVWDTIWPWHCC